jgi:hypothetical protein
MSYGHADTINSAAPVPGHGAADEPRLRVGRAGGPADPPLCTVLAFIRVAECKGSVPLDDRLEIQPCELTA